LGLDYDYLLDKLLGMWYSVYIMKRAGRKKTGRLPAKTMPEKRRPEGCKKSQR